MQNRLFDANPDTDWATFAADGFDAPVAGRRVSPSSGTCCGVPLGGLGTGALDIQPDGTLGFSTLFPAERRQDAAGRYQPFVRSAPLALPFLGVSAGNRTWVLADRTALAGGEVVGCVEPGMLGELTDQPAWRQLWSRRVTAIEGVEVPLRMSYWGHFPVADIEYELGGPLSLGLRAWSPFILGDADASNIPGVIFEVRIRNTDAVAVHATVCLTFPGPVDTDPPFLDVRRRQLKGRLHGIVVENDTMGYALTAIDADDVRTGGPVASGPAWASIEKTLPSADPAEAGASLAVAATIGPGEERTIRFVLGWYARGWVGGRWTDLRPFEQWDIGNWAMPGREVAEGTAYQNRYTMRFEGPQAVVEFLARNHRPLLERTLAWQSAIYRDPQLPDWLKDCLVNHLSLLAEDSFWAAPARELGSWSYPDGAFGMVESPRGCAVTGCIVSNWYGDLPLTYFFPELERAILRNYAAYLRPDGAVPFLYPYNDLTIPTYEWLLPLNGPCFVDLVGRLWLRTSDDTVVREFYQAVKATTRFTMELRGGKRSVVAVHREGPGQEWWEHTPVYGVVTHAAGLRLATLQIAKRMAEVMGDLEFGAQCSAWLDEGRAVVESEQWIGDSYVFFRDEDTGRRSDDVHSSQLDGEWASRFHGFGGVFARDRVAIALETIEAHCLVPTGALSIVARDDGSRLAAATWPANAPEYGEFMAEMVILGATYMYAGQVDLGLDLVRRVMHTVVCEHGHGWDLPNMVRLATGERDFGTDYFQNLILWAVPAALTGDDLAGPNRPGGLVARILEATSRTSEAVATHDALPGG